ncbi:MAG TPA: iron-containing redox enzyme family protein [Alphaproteobacteria bacterium]|jgi:pyrroloquinoline-quinone synthase
MYTPPQFREKLLDTFVELRWAVPTLWEEFRDKNLTREGARVYALEHCVFAANFPRWLANITGNCPHLEVRQYLIENMFVEEVKDPTIVTGHYESLVDFAVALGVDRNFVYNYRGAPVTMMRIAYCDWASRTKPWLEGFAAIAGNEASRGKEIIARVGERARTSRNMWKTLGLSQEALAHWDAADEADSSDGGHGDAPLDIMMKYADTTEQQEACLAAIRDRQQVNRVWFDQIGQWAYEASGVKPPRDNKQQAPNPLIAA